MVKGLVVISILIGVGSFPVSAIAQSTDPSWLDSLRDQLRVARDCEARYFLNIRERDITAGRAYSARVQCEDGRQFDAVREDPAVEFTIESCEKAICKLSTQDPERS